jgi:hypothetical protein
MKAAEIHSRATTLCNACLKVSALIQSTQPIANFCRVELIRHASDLSIQSKGLTSGQAPAVFIDRLNRCVDASNGCAFWLDLVINDKLMDTSIISPLLTESNQMSQLFLGALNNAKSKIE